MDDGAELHGCLVDFWGSVEFGFVGIDVESSPEELLVHWAEFFGFGLLVDEFSKEASCLLFVDVVFGRCDLSVGVSIEEVFGEYLVDVLLFVHDCWP